MESPSSSQTGSKLTPARKSALLTLLADDDPAVYETVRSHILALGFSAVQWLRPHTFSPDPRLRRRVQEIVLHLERQEADNRFLAFCLGHGETLDLETGAWLLAQTQYPDINIEAYQALLDGYAADLRERLAGHTLPVPILSEINAYLFKELRFHANADHARDPESGYLNRVIDLRAGSPISLCVLYWLIGKRLGLPIVGIGLPGYFLCRYQGARESVFVDAFRQGRLLTRADCIRTLQQSPHGFQEGFLAPISPGRALLRMCSALHQTYSRLNMQEESARLQRYVIALAK
ncbi:MAG: transglutaminase-like domain-containing protein [Verrucomicrobiae bacterium]|nr:transglutaminase-like domain-containing protein [Verrucomicrobiae bacterium]